MTLSSFEISVNIYPKDTAQYRRRLESWDTPLLEPKYNISLVDKDLLL